MESTINQFKETIDKLLMTADTLYQGGLCKDDNGDPETVVIIEAWERYKKIVSCIMAARSAGWDIIEVRYTESPGMVDRFSSVTITLPEVCTLPNEARAALALASMLADKVTTTAAGSNVRIKFTVNDTSKPKGWMDDN